MSAAIFLTAPLARYAALHSDFWDLGIFQSGFIFFSRAGEWQQACYGHVQVFLPLWAKLYSRLDLFYAPFFLLFFQAVFLIIPVAVFWRIFGVFPAFVYLAYAPLWSNALFDFHFDHLVVPIMLGFYLAVQHRRLGWAISAALLLMCVKEPFALQTAACGVFLAWVAGSNKLEKRWFVAGAFLILAGWVYFYFVTHYVFPYFMAGENKSPVMTAFGWLGNSFSEMAWTIISQPQLIFWEIISTPKKLIFLFVVFGLLALVPLLRPIYLIPALPLLLIAMLSRVENYYDYANHYTAGLIIPVMFAFVHGLRTAERKWLDWSGSLARNTKIGQTRLIIPAFDISIDFVDSEQRKRLFYGLLCSWILIGHIVVSPSPISRLFWLDKIWSYSWRAYVPSERDAMMKAAMEKYIPNDPTVSVAAQNSVNWGRLAHREVYLPFPLGIATPHKFMDWSNRNWDGFWEFVESGYMPPAITNDHYASYVVLDLKRPYFLFDRGCDWVYGECQDKKIEKLFLDWVAYTRRTYVPIFEQDGFIILRRSES